MSSAGLVESNSRKYGLKRSRLFWVFLATGIVLLSFTIVVAVLSTQEVTFPKSGEYIEINAEKLVDKPQSYVSLNNPDPYLLDALSSPGKYVNVLGENQMDEQIGTNSTSYVEFEGSFYEIHQSLVIVDYPAPYNRGGAFSTSYVGFVDALGNQRRCR